MAAACTATNSTVFASFFPYSAFACWQWELLSTIEKVADLEAKLFHEFSRWSCYYNFHKNVERNQVTIKHTNAL